MPTDRLRSSRRRAAVRLVLLLAFASLAAACNCCIVGG
jgi:hypothetical protein